MSLPQTGESISSFVLGCLSMNVVNCCMFQLDRRVCNRMPCQFCACMPPMRYTVMPRRCGGFVMMGRFCKGIGIWGEAQEVMANLTLKPFNPAFQPLNMQITPLNPKKTNFLY